MTSNPTLGRMDTAGVQSLISGKSAASSAQLVARSESKLTEADRDSLASGNWADDVGRITHGRLFYVDLPKAIAARAAARKRNKSGGGLSKDARESLKTDAAMLLVQWADAREARTSQGETRNDGKLVCKLGGAGNLPFKRDWLAADGAEKISLAAWDAMNVALNAAERADSEYAARKREEKARTGWSGAQVSVDELLADGMDSLTAAEKASLVNDIDTYGRAWRDRAAPVMAASTSEVAALLGLSETAARYLASSLLHMNPVVAQVARRAYPGRAARVIHGQEIEKARKPEPARRAQPAKVGRLSKAACAHQWGVSMAAVDKILVRGAEEVERKYPNPSDLLAAIRAAALALPAIRDDAAREAIREYVERPDDSPVPAYGPRNKRASEADAAAREYLSAIHTMPAEARALFVASVKRVNSDVAGVLVESIPRLIAAEDRREFDNCRAGKRGILAGTCDSASDNPLYIGKRDWRSALEDGEILANRAAIAARAADRFRRYTIARLCPQSLAACLVALQVRESARQRAHDRQVQLAVEQALDASNSDKFHPVPNPYGRAYLAADRRAMADVEARMAAREKIRLEAARQARIERKRAMAADAATAARKRS